MSNNIVEIDLNKLDAAIVEAQKQLEVLISTKKYAQSIAIKASPVLQTAETTASNNKSTVRDTKAKSTSVSKAAKPLKATGVLGVTDFILKFLKSNDKVDSNAVIKAYSVYLNKTEEQVTGNVANALSRLKTSKKANNEPKPDGKKGTLWFLTSKK